MPTHPRSLWRTDVFACPRCRHPEKLGRGPLVSHSTFLPEGQRGQLPLARVWVHCSFCDYQWLSVSQRARELPEDPAYQP
jgi:hypothetical protein